MTSVTTETDFLGHSTDDRSIVQVATRHLSVRSVEDLSLYEDHSAIIERLCRELSFDMPAAAPVSADLRNTTGRYAAIPR